MPAPVLLARNLCKSFGALKAVDDVSFEVAAGEIVGLVGPNGAGKTTTINMILGVLAPSSGRIEIEGIDLARDRSRALSATNFAAVYAPLPGNLTVEQNLRVFGMINTAAGFVRTPAVINGFSDLIVELWGPDRGRHARSAVGQAALPFDIPVEIEAEVALTV